MKHIYSGFLSVVLSVLFFSFSSNNINGQTCPNSGSPGTTAFDTTIIFPAGVISTPVKFPKFNPLSGMVTCVRLCVTIKGIVDTVALQNYSSGPQTGAYTYDRTDVITGPGIATSLTSTANLNFGPFPLAAYDGVPGSGPDFYGIGRDTVLTRTLCVNISDSATISDFYGTDSVTYNYDVNANAGGSVTGGSQSVFVLSSAAVNFRFQYCTCPALALPLNINQFTAEKITTDKAELKWSGFDQPNANYRYEAQVSRNPYSSFESIGSFSVNKDGTDGYRTVYQASNTESGSFYFRIRQIYGNGYVRYTDVRKVTLESSGAPKFSLYPNPSQGIVGIKFDNNSTGNYTVQIFNTQGQMLMTKDIVATGTSSVQVATLKNGAYLVRVVDTKTRLACVNQVLIK